MNHRLATLARMSPGARITAQSGRAAQLCLVAAIEPLELDPVPRPFLASFSRDRTRIPGRP